MKRILVIAAHPDDELLGCGGSIAKYINNGVLVKVLFLGEGSTARYDDPSCKEAEAAITLRNSRAVEALRVIGVTDFEFFNLPCGRFDQVPIIEINKYSIRDLMDINIRKELDFIDNNCLAKIISFFEPDFYNSIQKGVKLNYSNVTVRIASNYKIF